MKRTQIIVISVAALVVVLLFILPKSKPVAEKKQVELKQEKTDDIKTHVDAIVAQLDSSSFAITEKIKNDFASQADKGKKTALLDSLIAIWDFYRKPLVSAYYSEQKVDLDTSAKTFKEVADRYFFSTNQADEHLKLHLFEKAEVYYSKFIVKEPSDIEAKINLAVCYVESSKDPMKGISILKEVLEKDPSNIKAHLNLGYFSIKSGQFDKAIDRFEKVLKIDPKHTEALLYLGDVYESKGEVAKAIEYYEKYKASLTDKAEALEVQSYIQKLKNKL